jgi:iron complex outermembrane recepter protein
MILFMLYISLRAAVSAPALVLAAFAPAFAQEQPDNSGSGLYVAPFIGEEAPELEQQRDVVVVTGEKPVQEQRPTTTEIRSGEEIAETTNVINAEDSLRYFPNILVRKRHVGDTQAPIATRTSGVGASARSLIYADGVLLSALIGNNNSNASPKWGVVSPEEIASASVLYGPFSAAYAGNSIGAVVEIETRMPEKLEGTVGAGGSVQSFDQYATSGDYGAWQASAMIGNRIGPVSFWLAATHTDSDSQPLAYVTATRPVAASSAGTPLSGAFADFNRAGAPIIVLGAGGLEEQSQDNIKLKASWDITDDTSLAYTIGRFANETSSDVESYLRNAAGGAVFSGGPFNIDGYSYSIAASAFSNNVYELAEEQWSQSFALSSRSKDGRFDWRIIASAYDYDQSEQRLPSTALPAARTGGAGSITRGDGTRWQTLDAKGVWRPQGVDGAHEVSFGAHGDRYELTSERFSTTNWLTGPAGPLASASRGKTQTSALWAQDAWRFAETFRLIAGGRFESWKAYDGLNYSLAPALNVQQPEREAEKFSPKASLEWAFAPDWTAKVSVGQAYRFPTVGELYQAVTTGAVLTVPNPNLKPEDAISTEWSLERRLEDGNVRLSVFTEDIADALISQSAPLLPGSTTLFNYVQNVDKMESRGVELVAAKDNVLITGLSLTGSLTYVDSKTAEDAAFPAAVGKQTPQVPEWRSTLVATYRPDDKWSFTLAGRYVDRVYGTIDNSDSVSHTYQGFEGFMTWDARVSYEIDPHWTAAAGIENFASADYFLFHPFPQRTGTAELQYRF